MIINELLFCRSTGCTADGPGTAKFSRECLEVEGSLQNPQEIKRTSQVLILCLHGSVAQQTHDGTVTCLMIIMDCIGLNLALETEPVFAFCFAFLSFCLN